MKGFSRGIWFAVFCGMAFAVPEEKEAAAKDEMTRKLREGSEKVAEDQDELAADVQQLTIEETVPEVIELLQQVGEVMDEATDRLLKQDTGGETIAAQTEIIEKIHTAAKERQKQQGSGDAGGAMMDMMERMMGKEPGRQGQNPGEPGGDQGGPANKFGKSDTPNEEITGDGSEKTEVRKVPKASGQAGRALPEEFGKALDAYNRGAERRVK